MGYRLLVDENLDPRTADLLRERGHDAVTIQTTLGKGTEDPPIARFARRNDRALLTNDADFLRPEERQGSTVLYCPENTMRAHRIATLVDGLAALVPNQADLPPVTWLTE